MAPRTAKLIKMNLKTNKERYFVALATGDNSTAHGLRMHSIGLLGGLLYSCQVSDRSYAKITKWIMSW